MTLPPMAKPRPYWRRVASNTWVVLGTDLALQYCPANCHFIAYRSGRPLFQVLTLAEADEWLTDRTLCEEGAL
jgi:hypothetical protein